jgi:hypothetical protein
MNETISLRLRISRFLRERYHQRERPGSFAELFLFALIVITAMWAIFSSTYTLANGNWLGTLARIWF